MARVDAYSTVASPHYLDEDEPIGADSRRLHLHRDYSLTDNPVSPTLYLPGSHAASDIYRPVEYDRQDTPFRPPSVVHAETSVPVPDGGISEFTQSVSSPLEGLRSDSNQPTNILRDDQAFIALQPDEINTMLHSRVSFVLCVLREVFSRTCWKSRSCPWVKDLWLRMIEDSNPASDIWLWQDGDEEWIACKGNWSYDSVWMSGEWCTGEGIREDLLDAQLALRHRLECIQDQTGFPELTLEEQQRNTRIREARPEQRIAAIAWLIVTSRHKTEMEYHHGRSVALYLDVCRDVGTWWSVIKMSHFPKDSRWSETWEKMKKERADTKCDCMSLYPAFLAMWEEWFAMVVWFQPVLDFDWKGAAFQSRPCDGCDTRAAPIYERIYGPRARYGSYLPPGSTFIFYILGWCREGPAGVREKDVSFARAVLAKILSPAVTSKFDKTWTSLPTLDSDRLGGTGYKYRFAPWIYQYPRDLRYLAMLHACSIGPYSTSNIRAPESVEAESAYLAALPQGLADDAPNLTVMLGTLIWILACYSSGPSGWHLLWLRLMREPLEVLSVPTLQDPTSRLYDCLYRRRHDAEGSRSIQVNRTRFWKAYTATLVYVKSKRLGPKFQGCPTCHAMYLRVFPNPSRQSLGGSSADIERPGSAGQRPPAPDSEHVHTELLEESTATSSRIGPRIDFRSTILDDSLSLDEKQRIFEQQLQNLANFATSHGLRLPNGLMHAVSPSNSRECPGTRLANGMAPRRELVPRQVGSTDTAAGHPIRESSSTRRKSNLPSTSASSTPNNGQGKRTQIIKESKERLVSMLGEIGFTLPKNRLPWSTLEEELKEFGYIILNWPDGVVRENERGMHGLNIQQAGRLRHALTREDDSRLRFVRCVTETTESVVDTESTASESHPGISSPKRARGGTGNDRQAKKARFRVTTAEEYAEVVNDA